MDATYRIGVLVGLVWLSGCDLGGGGGGGPAASPLPERPAYEASAEPPDPAARGKVHYHNLGCALCHGDNGAGGVRNRNAETGGLINGLIKVRESYSAEELAKVIREGVPRVGKKDPRGPMPPLRMPGFGSHLAASQLGDLVAYLFGLHAATPEKVQRGADDWDAEDTRTPRKRTAPARDDWDEDTP